MRKYIAHVSMATIEPIEINRETVTSVIFNGRRGYEVRANKISERHGYGYFDTFEEARQFIIEKLEWNVATLIRTMNHEQDKIEKVKELKEA